MRVFMGIIRGTNGVFYARKKVPARLTEAVSQVTGAKTPRVSWLKRSLRTRERREANIVGKPILIEFDRVLARAEAALKAVPVRDDLGQKEIDRIADYYYAAELAEDDDIRQHGTGSEPVFQAIAKQLAEAGIVAATPFAITPPPAFGLSEREMYKIGETLEDGLALAKHALARGDISEVGEEVDELLAIFRLNLDRKGLPYHQLGLSVLRKKVAALQALAQRHEGEVVDTPRAVEPTSPEQSAEGGTLRDAFEGWKKSKARGAGTIGEFDHAIGRFEELHGNMPVVSIARSHVRQYREALQSVPVRRSGKLRNATLPALARISHSDGCIGWANQRKLFCNKHLI